MFSNYLNLGLGLSCVTVTTPVMLKNVLFFDGYDRTVCVSPDNRDYMYHYPVIV